MGGTTVSARVTARPATGAVTGAPPLEGST